MMSSKSSPTKKVGLFVYEEDSVSGELHKKRLPPLSEYLHREGIALSFPLNREPFRGEPPSRMETLSVPLPSATVSDIADLRAQYGLLAAHSKNSLAGFVCLLRLLGFQIFEKSALAIAYTNAAKNTSLVTVLNESLQSSGVTSPDATMAVALLTKMPRGNNRVWSLEALNSHMTKIFGKSATEFNQALANHLYEQADSWDSVTPLMLAEVLSAAVKGAMSAQQLLSLASDETNFDEFDDATQSALVSRSIAFRGDGITSADISERYFIQQAIAVAAKAVRQDIGNDFKSEHIALHLLSGATFNGVSWLFGSGVNLFAHQRSAIKKALAMKDNDEAALLAAHQSALKLLEAHTKTWGAFSDYRGFVGASLTSFTTIHVKRMLALKGYFDKLATVMQTELPQAWCEKDEYTDRVFLHLAIQQDEIHAQWQQLRVDVQRACEIIGQCIGVGATPRDSDFIHLNVIIDRVRQWGGTLRQIHNHVTQLATDIESAASSDVKAKLSGTAERCALPESLQIALNGAVAKSEGEASDDVIQVGKKGLFEPPALVHIGGEEVSVDFAVKRADDAASNGVAWLKTYIANIVPNVDLQSTLLNEFKAREVRHRKLRGKTVTADEMDILARRHVLNEWFSFLRTLSGMAKDEAFKRLRAMIELAEEPSKWPLVCSKFMYEQKGAFYVSAFARRRHAAYDLDSHALSKIDFNELFDSFSQWSLNRVADNRDAMLDYVRIQCKLAQMTVKAAPTRVPSTLVDPARAGKPDSLKVELFPAQQWALNATTVTADNVRKIVMRVESAIRDAASISRRASFQESFNLKPLESLKELVYIPRLVDQSGQPRYWKAPNRLLKGTSEPAIYLQKIWPTVSDGGKALVSKLVDHVMQVGKEDKAAIALLAEFPHEWGFAPELSAITGGKVFAPKTVVLVEKGSVRDNKKPLQVFPFSGDGPEQAIPRHWINLFDAVLKGEANNAPGQIRVDVKWARKSNGIDIDSVKVSLQQPVKSEVASVEADPRYLERMIGIDIGERGFGYSVRTMPHAGDSELVAKGVVYVSALRHLDEAVESFKKRTPPKFKRGYSMYTSSDKIIDAVAGKVLSAIKQLMWHYRAIPVVESELHEIENISSEMKLVFTRVQQMITFTDSEGDAKREHMWRGKFVKHPHWAMQITNKKTGEVSQKAMNLFPGVSVAGAGSSQECSCCRRNATAQLRAENSNQFHVDRYGKIELSNGVIQLGTAYAKNNKYHVDPLQAGLVSREEAIKLVYALRRLKPLTAQQKDSTQSRYRCVYVDCVNHSRVVHADANAADVLVQRKLSRLVRV